MVIGAAVAGVAALIGGAAQLCGEERAIVRQAQRMPEVAARDVRDQERVKLVGRIVRLGAELEAPLSRRSCVAYRVRLHGSRDATGVYAHEERKRDFLLGDAAGDLVWVRARAARLIDVPDFEVRVGERHGADARVAAFLERHGQRLTARRRPSMRYVLEEGVLAVGDAVTIVGRARHELDPSELLVRPLRQAPLRVVLEAGVEAPLYVIPAARRPA